MTVRSLLRLRKQSSRHERDMNATYRPNPLISLERKQVSNPQVAGSNPAGDAKLGNINNILWITDGEGSRRFAFRAHSGGHNRELGQLRVKDDKRVVPLQ